MMYPYAEMLMRFATVHPDFVHTDTGDGQRLALIIESQPNFWLPFILRNVMFFLGPGWRLCIVCSPQTEFFLRGTTRGWAIDIKPVLPFMNFTRSQYNLLLRDEGFWQQFPEEKIFMFQTDSLLCRHGIDEYLGYDFIGAPCGNLEDDFVMNGGLSLRTRGRMEEACLKNRIGIEHDIPEDVFFTQSLRQAGAVLPILEEAMDFAVETVYRSHPLGVHGTDKYYHSLDTALRIATAIQY